MEEYAASFATFPSFLAYFLGGTLLLAAFAVFHTRLTPHHELALVRAGNSAAAIALVGALLGFVIPLATVIALSASVVELFAWGGVAMVIQLGGFITARLVFPGLSGAIEQGQLSEAIFLAGLSLALGILDAACMAG